MLGGSDGGSSGRNGHPVPILIAGLMSQGVAPIEQPAPPKPSTTGDPVEQWPFFVDAVRRRLLLGARNYADEPAAEKPLTMLLDEIATELEDLAGWGSILWGRVQAMRAKLEAVAREEP